MIVYYDKSELEFKLMLDIEEVEKITKKKAATLKKKDVSFINICRKQHTDVMNIVEYFDEKNSATSILIDSVVQLLNKLTDLSTSVENVNLTLQDILAGE
jgi:adenylosuccinate synthase